MKLRETLIKHSINMVKRCLVPFLFLLLTAVQSVYAQKMTSFGQSGSDAKAILDAASKKFKSYKSAKADFLLKVSNTSNKVLDTKKGSILLKGNQFNVQLAGQEIFCNGKTIWTYNKDTKEVQVNNYQPKPGSISPESLFNDFYDKDFLYRLRATSKFHNRPVDVIEMTPLDKSKPYFKVIILIDKQNKNVVSTEIYEKGGNRYIYEVEKFMPNAPAAEADFAFNKANYPGVEVVDLR
ncbi:MAG: outer membrane lipoprotein carrier protein LolA [Chitinophagaceae bacterium]|nr:MAG: outer membrane lipoprotein carrier protein LolA [Chitinophagaceae bacterium]